ncbi:hypothetical protein COV20_01280 [Candidatus Woesearchaeota archaeon CG10_big_fil_rev_8_21_14_0_10_45_16]|nr:MAG: hypothetical protein COV20_01280 [Candidatus Woesearchaeota archaeon CG10_big_fil_rev_8_21_14_0_10_45_16]
MKKRSNPLSRKMRPVSKKKGQLSKIFGQKIREYYYEHPADAMTVRALALKLKLNRSTVQYHLQQLRKEGFIDKNNLWVDSWSNKLQKSHYFTLKIASSGLVQYLESELGVSAIILFGSFSKGDSVKESDIDLFVECARQKQLELQKFERLLGHKIELFTKARIYQLPKPLLNNVVNGIKLKGYFTLNNE